MFKEFKKFAMRGNVMDLAVGVIIGGAFGKIVTSLVNDIITPLMGLLIGGYDFKELKVPLAVRNNEVLALNIGIFIQSVVDFLIISFSIFLFIKALERFKKKEESKPSAPSRQEVLLEEIRDLLKEQNK